MSLYGLDLIVQHGREPTLLEINGVNSGMKGFRQVYGDTRVEDRVYGMLRERHGEIHVAGSHFLEARKRIRLQQIRDTYPIRSRFWELKHAFFETLGYEYAHPLTFAQNGNMEWLTTPLPGEWQSPFPEYCGGDVAVLNVVNDQFPRAINPYAAQTVADNKFFQYRMLRDTELASHVIPSAIAGLDITDHDLLEELLAQHRHVIIKPLLGICGFGVRKLHRDNAKALNATHPRITYAFPRRCRTSTPFSHVRDYLEDGDFTFEYALSLVQPFIDSRHGRGQHTSVRAIVCNGEFVDAYARKSPHYRVNLAQGATARSFHADGAFREFCERTVAVLEQRSAEYRPETFRHQLWRTYLTELENRGRAHWQMIGTRELVFVFNALGRLAGEKIDGDGGI